MYVPKFSPRLDGLPPQTISHLHDQFARLVNELATRQSGNEPLDVLARASLVQRVLDLGKDDSTVNLILAELADGLQTLNDIICVRDALGRLKEDVPGPSGSKILCWSCGANWAADCYTAACEECGGGALTRACAVCGGKCGNKWIRAVIDSNDFRLAHWQGGCLLSPKSDYAIDRQGFATAVSKQQTFEQQTSKHHSSAAVPPTGTPAGQSSLDEQAWLDRMFESGQIENEEYARRSSYETGPRPSAWERFLDWLMFWR
jgi:hypothetical protein